ncbi:MAG: hypothetical protein ACLUNV_05570 [Sutterella wadsworthensis]
MKALDAEHMKSNLDAFGLTLEDEDMTRLDTMQQVAFSGLHPRHRHLLTTPSHESPPFTKAGFLVNENRHALRSVFVPLENFEPV